jgi:acetyl esterase/lipase
VAGVCRLTGAAGLVPDYRLAPEHPIPAAADDGFQVYHWLLANGYDSKQIVIAGDSAGGSLALSTLLRARDTGPPLPACAVMLCPATDMTLRGVSFVENRKSDVMLTLYTLMVFLLAYMRGAFPVDPIFPAPYAGFHDLPPLFFQVSREELLRDSSVPAAQKAKAAGVPVVLDMYDGMPHCFGLFGLLPVNLRAVDHAVGFIKSWMP